MKLSIPFIRQPKDSVDCGPVCLAMICSYYYGKPLPAGLETLTRYKAGTYAPQLGLFLLAHGFAVEIITQQPRLFRLTDKKLTGPQQIVHLKKILKTRKNAEERRTLNFFIRFLENGGTLKIKIPDVADIKREIRAKRPLIALLTTNFMQGKKPGMNFHYNVITGIDEKNIYTNDPDPIDNKSGQYKHSHAEYLYGLHACLFRAYDNGCLITIKKK